MPLPKSLALLPASSSLCHSATTPHPPSSIPPPPLPLLSIYPSLVCLHTWVSLTPSLPFSSLCLFVCFPSVSGADTLQSALHAGITIISINSYFKCFKTHTHTHLDSPVNTSPHEPTFEYTAFYNRYFIVPVLYKLWYSIQKLCTLGTVLMAPTAGLLYRVRHVQSPTQMFLAFL